MAYAFSYMSKKHLVFTWCINRRNKSKSGKAGEKSKAVLRSHYPKNLSSSCA
jgi:hypothetical protein